MIEPANRVYLAGPMTGIEEFNYPAFRAAAKLLRDQGYDVVSPAELHGSDFSRPFGYYLRRDLTAMLTCEAVVVLPGWQNSRGATLEVTTAIGVDMPIRSFDAETGEVAPL